MSEELNELSSLKYKQKASELLQFAKERVYQNNLLDTEDDTILRSLDREYDEAHTHSNILFWLMSRPCKKDRSDSFLLSLLKELKIPPELYNDKWTPYRERHFKDGRIDFVLESPRFVVCIEMKIDAGDQPRQLERYESFCKGRRKEYSIFYLTLKGDGPGEQSIGNMDTSKLRCISFQDEILSWLEKCLTYTEVGGYKYSYIKQYIGTVHRIVDCEGGNVGVNNDDNLITDTESAKAALFLQKELKRKITKVLNDFFFSLADYLKKDTKYKFDVWEEGIEALLDSIQVDGMEYQIYFSVKQNDSYIYGIFWFWLTDKNNDGYQLLSFEEVKKKVPQFYKKWADAIRAKIEDFRREKDVCFYFYIENTNGEKLSFKKYSPSVLEMIDDLDIQVEYIGDYLSNQVIKKVADYATQ